MVGSREQYRGEAVVELNCFTVYDQVIIEAEELIAGNPSWTAIR